MEFKISIVCVCVCVRVCVCDLVCMYTITWCDNVHNQLVRLLAFIRSADPPKHHGALQIQHAILLTHVSSGDALHT